MQHKNETLLKPWVVVIVALWTLRKVLMSVFWQIGEREWKILQEKMEKDRMRQDYKAKLVLTEQQYNHRIVSINWLTVMPQYTHRFASSTLCFV